MPARHAPMDQPRVCGMGREGEERMQYRILVVDDEEPIRKMLATAFAEIGFTVVLAGSAEEALEILKKERIQVMFLDLKLPNMNGLELCRQIRKDYPIACVFAMTAWTSLFELVNCRDAGFDDYFTKPVDLEMLFKTARDAFEKIERWTMRSGIVRRGKETVAMEQKA